MAPLMRNQMLEEAAIAARFSDIYRRQFAELIDRLNHNLEQPVDRHGLRLCIEAVDMMLAMQTYITGALAQLGATSDAIRHAA